MNDVLPNQRVHKADRGEGTVLYGLRQGKFRVRFDSGAEEVVHQDHLEPAPARPRMGQAH
ncbi:hypothetical protein G6045_32205 [Streptomyces sp. YC504]|uniref:DUF1918 domain-containing protein n=1 Tax=Streptomyces mesophilus TaxID=1775132 RepID=A0A6G4XRS2_9ACTN|nr:hypothetical protein [Streptomyces mesophilus]NGO80289.1 hypothetical protein [Streptomyces mesophilus]